jgi:hypothetical protein
MMNARDSQGNNCKVLGTSREAADYIATSTPMQTKKKEYANDPAYVTKAESDLNRSREKSVTAARRGGNVRPLDGGNAQ